MGKENASPSSKKPRRLDQEDNWNVTRTSEFIDKSDEVIKDADELRRLEEFITRKVRKVSNRMLRVSSSLGFPLCFNLNNTLMKDKRTCSLLYSKPFLSVVPAGGEGERKGRHPHTEPGSHLLP